ncbi:MAG: PASTA domain-containing protein, partial [Methanosarcinales archaeon]|nr:PASTA domain-containing protein [Methanosarcinales archaeon]
KYLNDILIANNKIPMLGNVYSKDAEIIYNNLAFSFHNEGGIDYGFTVKKNNSITQKANPILENMMPNVVGMSLKDAFYVLENKEVKIRYKGKGKIVKQSIAKGEKIRKGQIIVLDLEL